MKNLSLQEQKQQPVEVVSNNEIKIENMEIENIAPNTEGTLD